MTIELDPSQHLAVRLMIDARFCVVTGGAGTGKTTCLRFALDELDARQQSYRLASPTGKAAKRMAECTGRPACTIHRLLEWRGKPQRNHLYPLETSAVVIDEASMLDVELFAQLLDAINPECTRLVLMGDANQLPSVGPGFVLGELVECGLVPVARLTTLHRAAEQSWINTAAQAVLRREMPDLHTPRADFRFVHVEDPTQIMGVVTDLITRVIPREIDRDAQVLIPQKPGAAGILQANIALQAAVNQVRDGERAFVRKDKSELRMHDRVIQVRNNYQLGVFNGEIGTVLDVSDRGVLVAMDGGDLLYTFSEAAELQLAYALTVHKMQGSEFPWIVFVCHSTHTHMLSPQLLYTAITRGKQGVIIVGNEDGVRRGLRQQNPPRRNTGLADRLRHADGFAA